MIVVRPPLLASPGYLPGSRFPPCSPGRIIVAEEDRTTVDQIVGTLRGDGHVVFSAYDVLSAVQLAQKLPRCDLVISNTKSRGN